MSTRDEVKSREQRIEDLARWLSLPLAGNRPIFPISNPFTGDAMHLGAELEETWVELFGDEAAPQEGREWKQCPECAAWHVERLVEIQNERISPINT